MISRMSISGKLEKLSKYVGYLKEYQKCSLQDITQDYTLQGAVCHYLQLSIESVIDMGEILISMRNWRRPQDSREVFDILAEQGVLPKDFAEKFAPVVSFRNILVHEYTEVNIKQVYEHLSKDLNDFDRYAQYLASAMKI